MDDIVTCVREATAALIRADDGIRVGADVEVLAELRANVSEASDALIRIGELLLGKDRWEQFDENLDEAGQ